MRVLLITILAILTLNSMASNKKLKIKSPSSNLYTELVQSEDGIKLMLSNKAKGQILEAGLGNFILGQNSVLNSYNLDKVEKNKVRESWKPVYGEKSVVSNNYNELTLSLSAKDDVTRKIKIECRVYDEGVAFRYVFDEEAFKDVQLLKELTTFDFDQDYFAWHTNRAQGAYQKVNISKIKNACERPLVIEQNNTTFLAIGEAALVDYARMKLVGTQEKENSLTVSLDGQVDLKVANYKSPWRFIMVADTPGKLVENNYLLLNLNEANKINDTSWIKPGKVIREVTLTSKGGMACIDFAAKHNLQYVEFDAGWYGNEYDNASDASTITVDPKRSPGPLELHKVIEYGKKKGVGIIVYVNRRALEKQLDEILPLYKSWGIKGLKYGFVNVGPQKWTTWLHDAVRKAAEYEMMVDIHDEYRPTGYSRTYPNLMTQEGIRGDEESPSVEQSLITAFTRMIAGAGDYTNCFLAPRVSEKMGGKAAQMAKSILLYSPWQFLYWYDRPEKSDAHKGGAGASKGRIKESEELSFYDALPTTWDETKMLEGKIGEFATIARKKGDDWFIGSLTSKEKRTVDIAFNFLEKNVNYTATLYYQEKDDLQENKVKIKTFNIDSSGNLMHTLQENSGFALVLTKKK